MTGDIKEQDLTDREDMAGMSKVNVYPSVPRHRAPDGRVPEHASVQIARATDAAAGVPASWQEDGIL